LKTVIKNLLLNITGKLKISLNKFNGLKLLRQKRTTPSQFHDEYYSLITSNQLRPTLNESDKDD